MCSRRKTCEPQVDLSSRKECRCLIGSAPRLFVCCGPLGGFCKWKPVCLRPANPIHSGLVDPRHRLLMFLGKTDGRDLADYWQRRLVWSKKHQIPGRYLSILGLGVWVSCTKPTVSATFTIGRPSLLILHVLQCDIFRLDAKTC